MSTQINIFVYDFDLTLSTGDTRGEPIKQITEGTLTSETIISDEQLHRIIDNFIKIKQNPNNKIIILSRGIQTQLIEFLNLPRFRSFRVLIDEIHGAQSAEDILKRNWDVNKAIILDSIATKYRVQKDNVHFFDHTQDNIRAARRLDINNSYLILDPNDVFAKLDDILKRIHRAPPAPPALRVLPVPPALHAPPAPPAPPALRVLPVPPASRAPPAPPASPAPPAPPAPQYMINNNYVQDKLMDLIPDSDGYVDVTQIFNADLEKAITYFRRINFNRKCVIYSSSENKYYFNTSDNPTIFIPIVNIPNDILIQNKLALKIHGSKGYADASDIFNNDVGNAIHYFKRRNPHMRVTVYSQFHNLFFLNTIDNPVTFWPLVNSDEDLLIQYKLAQLRPDMYGYVDASNVFERNFNNAIAYFKRRNPSMRLVIYSYDKNKFYLNTIDNPIIFTPFVNSQEDEFTQSQLDAIPVDENGYVDATGVFESSVNNAIAYFIRRNPSKNLIIFSQRSNNSFLNTFDNPINFTPVLNKPVLNKPVLNNHVLNKPDDILDQPYNKKYLKYKSKYMKLKNLN